MHPSLRRLACAAAALTLAAACSGSHDDHTSDDDDGHNHGAADAGHDHGGDAGNPDGGGGQAVSGVSVGGHLAVTVAPVAPAVPARGMNTFRFTVTRAGDGAAVSGLTLSVRPWMPAHGHGSTPVPTVTEDTATSGVFSVSNVNLTMAGTWELQATFGGAHTDTFVASFVVP